MDTAVYSWTSVYLELALRGVLPTLGGRSLVQEQELDEALSVAQALTAWTRCTTRASRGRKAEAVEEPAKEVPAELPTSSVTGVHPSVRAATASVPSVLDGSIRLPPGAFKRST